MLIDLTADERDVVLSVLTTYLGDLREELYKAEATDFKAALRERQAPLLSAIDKLQRGS